MRVFNKLGALHGNSMFVNSAEHQVADCKELMKHARLVIGLIKQAMMAEIKLTGQKFTFPKAKGKTKEETNEKDEKAADTERHGEDNSDEKDN